jgi:hypoxanthine phosphoribosyltransferase
VKGAAERSGQLGGRSIRRVVFTQQQIRERVEALGREITAAYAAEDDLLVLGLLKGSFVFLADLVRCIDCPLQVDFLIASSYGTGKVSSGEVRLLYDAARKLEGRAVIVVEDILDSGKTVNTVFPLLESRRPKSLDLCALLRKPAAELDWEPRWVGFDAPAEFLVGYGLDHGEDLRHLPYIAAL